MMSKSCGSEVLTGWIG